MHFYSRFANAAIRLAKTGQEMQQAIQTPDHCAHSDMLQRLERVRSIIDGKFVAACEILPRSLEGIHGLRVSLDRLAATFNAEIMATTRAELTLAAAKLCSLPASEAKQTDTIDRLNRSIEKLGRHIDTMRKMLAVMGDYVRDQTSHGEDGVGDLVAKIYAQTSRSSAELQAFKTELRLLKRELGLATVQGKIRNRKAATLIPAVPDELAAATRLINDRYTAVVATAEKVSQVVGDIHRRIDDLLSSLQIGDITRQRIEHILACAAEVKTDAAQQPKPMHRRFEATCYALVAEHLAQINADFMRQTGAIEDQMTEIVENTAQLLKLHEVAFDPHSGGFLHALAARLDAALRLITPVEAADKTALATERVMLHTAHELNGHIDRIRALRNAICTTISESADTARPAGCNLEDTMNVGLATLDEVVELTGTITTVAGEEPPLDSNATSAAAALANAARRLHEARDITEANLGEVTAEGEAVIAVLKQKTSQLCLRFEIGEILAQVAAEAATIAVDAYDTADELPEPLVRTLTGFSRFYTMARERDLHRTFLEARAIPCADPSPVFSFDGSDAFLF